MFRTCEWAKKQNTAVTTNISADTIITIKTNTNIITTDIITINSTTTASTAATATLFTISYQRNKHKYIIFFKKHLKKI